MKAKAIYNRFYGNLCEEETKKKMRTQVIRKKLKMNIKNQGKGITPATLQVACEAIST